MSDELKEAATVLVVEAEPMAKIMAVQAVEDQGYLALSATTAVEALSAVEAHGEIDVLFTDADLTAADAGIELAQAVRCTHPKMGLLIASRRRPRAAMMPAGAQYLQKPYRTPEVGDALRGLIDQSRPFVIYGK